jgi:hypothetical protein
MLLFINHSSVNYNTRSWRWTKFISVPTWVTSSRVVESSLFVLQHRETLSTVLLNSLRNVYDKLGKRRKFSASACTQEALGAVYEAVTRSPRKFTRRLPQMIGDATSAAWEICRDESTAQSGIVGRWNSERLRFCEGVRSATGGQYEVSWMSLECPEKHTSTLMLV